MLFRISNTPALVVNLGEYARAERWDVVMGRNEHCDLTLADSTLSRYHARLDHNMGAWTITDLASSNGTIVAERQLEAQRPEYLRDTAEVFIGRETYSMFYAANSFYVFCNEYHKRNRRETRRIQRRDIPSPNAPTERYQIRNLFPE